MHTRINPDQDEGLALDPKAIQMADLRAKIRKLIEDSYGRADRYKAHELGQSQIPTMAAQTIINFAYGVTKRPSTWTIYILAQVVEYEIIAVPKGTIVSGAMKFY